MNDTCRRDDDVFFLHSVYRLSGRLEIQEVATSFCAQNSLVLRRQSTSKAEVNVHTLNAAEYHASARPGQMLEVGGACAAPNNGPDRPRSEPTNSNIIVTVNLAAGRDAISPQRTALWPLIRYGCGCHAERRASREGATVYGVVHTSNSPRSTQLWQRGRRSP